MSKLLKSKFLIGAMIVTALFVGGLSVKTASASTTCNLGTTTLKYGMSGSSVTCLQTLLNVTPANGHFGPKTLAAVKSFQTTSNLKADGVVGPLSKTALLASIPVASSEPLCPNGMTLASNCVTAPVNPSIQGNCPTGYIATTPVAPTFAACMVAPTTSTFPEGCTSATGYSTTTGKLCSVTAPVITGKEGDLSVSLTSADTNNQATEGMTTPVLGFYGQATGSDLNVQYARVVLTNTGIGTKRLQSYASKVLVFMGSTQVGSMDVSDFSWSGDSYIGSIPLTGATISAGSANKQEFLIEVVANSPIDSGSATGLGTKVGDNYWNIEVPSIRFTDGTGVSMPSTNSSLDANFTFYKLANSGTLKLTVTKTTATPQVQNIQVSDTTTTTGVLLNEFTMKPVGADITIDRLTVNTNAITSTLTGTASDMIPSLTLKANGVKVAEIDNVAGGYNGGLTANTFQFNSDYNMVAGTTVIFDIYAKVNRIGTSTFAQGDSFVASYVNADTLTTVSGDTISATGSSNGNTQTFSSSGAFVTYSGESFTAVNLGNNPPATTVDGTISLKFTVNAFGDNDVNISQAQVVNQPAGSSVVAHAVTGATEDAAIVTCNSLTPVNGVYTIAAGDSATCTLASKFGSASGFVQLLISNVDNSAVSNIETSVY